MCLEPREEAECEGEDHKEEILKEHRVVEESMITSAAKYRARTAKGNVAANDVDASSSGIFKVSDAKASTIYKWKEEIIYIYSSDEKFYD